MGHNWIASAHPTWYPEWDLDFGEPVGDMRIQGSVVSRQWTKFNISLDLTSYSADFVSV